MSDLTTGQANERLAQEAWDHLRKTGVQSVDDDGQCIYGGTGCAFSPALKVPGKIECEARQIFDESPEELQDWARDIDPDFAEYVQNCHDKYGNLVDTPFLVFFAESLKQVCKRWGVKIPTGLDEYLAEVGHE